MRKIIEVIYECILFLLLVLLCVGLCVSGGVMGAIFAVGFLCLYIGRFKKDKPKPIETKTQTGVDFYKGYADQFGEILQELDNDADYKVIDNIIDRIKPPLQDEKLRGFIYWGLNLYVNRALDENGLTEDKQKIIHDYIQHFDLIKSGDVGIYDKINKGIIINRLVSGIVEGNPELPENTPFNLKKNEQPLFLFRNINQYEYKTRREYQGGSTGYSIRIAKGFYIRQNAFRGNPIEHTSLEHKDNGLLLLTDENIYYGGKYNIFKLPYNKILYISPNDDGITLQKDDSSAKPFVLSSEDAWFLYNVIYNLMKRK